jgi:hypothetical protein
VVGMNIYWVGGRGCFFGMDGVVDELTASFNDIVAPATVVF